jgi:hypothetical protein
VAGDSTDGGNTWTLTPLPGVTVNSGGTIQRASDPWVTIAPNGDVYASSLPLDDPQTANPYGVYVNKSTDGGLTWSNPVALITNSSSQLFNDKDSITADPTNHRYVYAVWDRLNSGGDPMQGPGPTLFSRTTNGGRTWSAPADVYDPANGQTIGNQIVVLPNGNLVDVFNHINYNSGSSTITVIISTDHGTTWSGPITVNTVQEVGVSDPDNGAAVRTGGDIPEIAINRRDGSLYVVWQDGRFSGGTHSDVAMSTSTDGGMTWSAPIKVNKTPTTIPAGDQQAFTPAVAVAKDGTVGVTYYDFRKNTPAPGLSTDYWLVTLTPNDLQLGKKGVERRLTNTSFNMELAPDAGGYFTGDYEGLVAGGQTFNSFGAFFSQAVSTSDPTSIFFRDPAGGGADSDLALGVSAALPRSGVPSAPLPGAARGEPGALAPLDTAALDLAFTAGATSQAVSPALSFAAAAYKTPADDGLFAGGWLGDEALRALFSDVA